MDRRLPAASYQLGERCRRVASQLMLPSGSELALTWAGFPLATTARELPPPKRGQVSFPECCRCS